MVAYNRPRHLAQCLEQLKTSRRFSRLPCIVALDGPQGMHDASLIRECKQVAQKVLQKNGRIHVQRKNLGCGRHIIRAVCGVLKEYESIIVVEDDLLVAPEFLDIMVGGLLFYRDALQVCSLNGYVLPGLVTPSSGYLQRGAECQGWATWRRAWNGLRTSAKELSEEIRGRGLVDDFNLSGTYDYFGMLEKVAKGQSNTWAVVWHASVFCANGLGWYPPVSLVQNVGLDGSGTHTDKRDAWLQTHLPKSKVTVKFPRKIEETPGMRLQMEKIFLRQAPLRKKILRPFRAFRR